MPSLLQRLQQVTDYFTPTPMREIFTNSTARTGAVLGAMSGAYFGYLNHFVNVSCQIGAYVYKHASDFECTFNGNPKNLCYHTGERNRGYHFKLTNCSGDQIKQLFDAAKNAADYSWTSSDIKTLLLAIPIASVTLSFIVVKVRSLRGTRAANVADPANARNINDVQPLLERAEPSHARSPHSFWHAPAAEPITPNPPQNPSVQMTNYLT